MSPRGSEEDQEQPQWRDTAHASAFPVPNYRSPRPQTMEATSLPIFSSPSAGATSAHLGSECGLRLTLPRGMSQRYWSNETQERPPSTAVGLLRVLLCWKGRSCPKESLLNGFKFRVQLSIYLLLIGVQWKSVLDVLASESVAEEE